MSEEQTQQREGFPSTRSLPHHRVTPKSDRSLDKKQAPPEQEIERFLRIFDLFKPRVVSTILVIVATYDYIRNFDVLRFLILMGAAAGYISLRQVIGLLLQGRSISARSSSLPEEDADENQDEP